jgi:NitT/TauT family transport system substrate-binding protein
MRGFWVLACMLVALSAPHAEAQRTVALEWLGATASIDPLYSYVPIAKEMGYLTSNGIAIDLTVTPMNGITIPPVVAGRAPIGYGAAEQLIGPAADGQDPGLTFFFNLNREPIFNVVVLPQSPIKTIRDLKGTTVGVQTIVGGPVPYIKGVFKTLGLDPDKDVEFSAVGVGSGALAELQRNDVQSLVQADTVIAALENFGAAFRTLPQEDYTKVYVTGGLFARRDFLAQHKDELCTFGRGIAMGLEFLVANPEAGVRLYWKYYPEAKPKGVDDATALKQTMHILAARIGKYDPRKQRIDKYGAYGDDEWQAVVKALGLTAKLPEDRLKLLYTNAFVDCFNDFDRAKVDADARGFKM